MTQEHPITPPPELVKEWQIKIEYCSKRADREAFVAKIFQLGADAELEACCEVLARELICDGKHVATDLRAVRRPKSPSLKELALDELNFSFSRGYLKKEAVDAIRRALESLPS